MRGGSDGGGCHDRKADVIRNEDDARDGFSTSQPTEDTSLNRWLARSQRQERDFGTRSGYNQEDQHHVGWDGE